MANFSKIIGTQETRWQIALGTNAVNVKNNSGAVELRDDDDSDFVVVRGATPVGVSDLTTKAYVDGISTGEAGVIRYAITNAADQDSTNSIPANAYIFDAWVEITTPYSAGATIAIGQSGTTNLLQDTTDNDAESAGIYMVPQNTSWGGSALPVKTTITGTPAAGAGVVVVRFAMVLV